MKTTHHFLREILALIRVPISGGIEHGVLVPGCGRTVAVPGGTVRNSFEGDVQGQLVPNAAATSCGGEVSRVEGSEDCVVDVGAVVPSGDGWPQGAVIDPEDDHGEDDRKTQSREFDDRPMDAGQAHCSIHSTYFVCYILSLDSFFIVFAGS